MWVRVQVIAFFFKCFFFLLLLLLQCDFNINLMPYSVSPTFFTPYDAQASSACSALIICGNNTDFEEHLVMLNTV